MSRSSLFGIGIDDKSISSSTSSPTHSLSLATSVDRVAILNSMQGKFLIFIVHLDVDTLVWLCVCYFIILMKISIYWSFHTHANLVYLPYPDFQILLLWLTKWQLLSMDSFWLTEQLCRKLPLHHPTQPGLFFYTFSREFGRGLLPKWGFLIMYFTFSLFHICSNFSSPTHSDLRYHHFGWPSDSPSQWIHSSWSSNDPSR